MSIQVNPKTGIPEHCIILDVETTGLSPAHGDRVVEIAAMKWQDGHPTEDIFHSLINPECHVSPRVVRIHGLDNNKLKDAPVFSDIADDLLDFIENMKVVAHNAIAFDMGFVNAELISANRTPIANKQWVDSLKIARRLYPGQPANLKALSEMFAISLKGRRLHGAADDVRVLADILFEMARS